MIAREWLFPLPQIRVRSQNPCLFPVRVHLLEFAGQY